MSTTSNYKNDVLTVNANFKIALRSTGQAIKILLASGTLNQKQEKFLKSLQAKGREAEYTKFDKSIRRTKSNSITPFYVLQAMHKALS